MIMDTKTFYKVQFCSDISDWVDYPSHFHNLVDAEYLAYELSARSELISTRLVRVEESILNEFNYD